MAICKALILSAGQGSRLLPMTRDIPKCLIEFAGQTLLGWQVKALLANDVNDIVVVTGFRTEKVENHVRELNRETGASIATLFNPFFQVADNLGTCWMARETMDGDIVILNGDTIVSDKIVARLMAMAKGAITVTIDMKPAYDDDDMKVRCSGDGRLLAIGKHLTPAETDAESIGMLALQGDGPAIFRTQIEQMMRTAEGVECWYLRAIDLLARAHRIETVSIHGLHWQEVDYPKDVDAARALTARWRSNPAIGSAEQAPRPVRDAAHHQG